MFGGFIGLFSIGFMPGESRGTHKFKWHATRGTSELVLPWTLSGPSPKLRRSLRAHKNHLKIYHIWNSFGMLCLQNIDIGINNRELALS